MGHRSTTIAFIIIMLAFAVIWIAYKRPPNQDDPATEKATALAGRVIEAATGEPVGGVEGTIASENSDHSYRLYVSADGRFVTDPLPQGHYVITIHSKNIGTTAVKRIAVTGDLEPPEVVVRLGAQSAGEADETTGRGE